MKYPKEKCKKIKEAMKINIFNLTNCSGISRSGENEITAQLKEKFCITGKEWKGSDSGSSSKTVGQLGKPNKS